MQVAHVSTKTQKISGKKGLLLRNNLNKIFLFLFRARWVCDWRMIQSVKFKSKEIRLMRPPPKVGECENSAQFWFVKNWKICECPIFSHEGLTLETSALQTLYGGQFTILTQLTRLNYFDTLFIKVIE